MQPHRFARVFAGCAVLWVLPAAPGADARAAEVEVAVEVTFLEGPTCDAAGRVFFSDTRGDRILRWSGAGGFTTFRAPANGANGNVFDTEERLVTCEGRGRRVTRTDLRTGHVEVLAERFEGKPLAGPNDVTIDGKGRIYFTDQGEPGEGGVFRIDPDGALARILAAPDVEKPNGLVVSPDALRGRDELGAGWAADDRGVRPRAGWEGFQPASVSKFLSRPEHGRAQY